MWVACEVYQYNIFLKVSLLSVTAHSTIGPVSEFLLEDQEFRVKFTQFLKHPSVGQSMIFIIHGCYDSID